MDATSLVVDFRDSSFVVAARLAKRLYDQHGCFLAKNLFAADQLSPINTFVEALVDTLFSNAGLVRPPGQVFQESIADLAKIDRTLVSCLYDAGPRLLPVHQLAVDSRMVELAKLMTGTALLASSDINAMRIDLPNEDKYLFDWHQDYPYVLDSLDGIVFWVPLQGVDEENGCLSLAVGSHQLGLLKMAVSDPDNRANNRTKSMRIADPSVIDRYTKVQLPLKFGDALAFNTLLIHASGPNRSEQARCTLQFRYGNFLHPVAIESGWPKAMRDGAVFHTLHPDHVIGNSADQLNEAADSAVGGRSR
jgi:ectoine hydroxylase-related dioxygenase (phytanoyl-CoA dioxygenase family)